MDIIWFKIVAGIQFLKALLDIIFGPLNALGPAVAIVAIALIGVAISKYLSKSFKTKRYKALRKDFLYWYNVRQEAMKCDNREKADRLARNIDQAKLNRLYYDYFFEGLLNNIVTKYLPILLLVAYVNEAYQPGNLLQLTGREYIFKLGTVGDHPLLVGSIFWFLISMVFIYLGAFGVKKLFKIQRLQGPNQRQSAVL
jgi:hypothetical protein